MPVDKHYEAWDGENQVKDAKSFDEAVAAVRELATPILICYSGAQEMWHVYRENDRWYQQHSDSQKPHDVTRKMSVILQRLAGEARWR